MMTPEPNTYFFYEGNVYRRIDEVQHKNSTTREWEVKVLYQDIKGLLYTRDIEEFYERFKEIDSYSIDAVNFKIIRGLNK